MIFNSKIKGIFKVSSTNIIGLALSMLTSFLLPIFISVEQYGYWQLFSMYCAYLGFFVLGFNDGVHLNYSTFDYDKQLAAKFRTFKSFLVILTAIESVALTIILLLFSRKYDNEFYVYFFCILNILPLALNGLFSYMNQATLRFNEYSIGNIIGKSIFTVVMVIMLLFGLKNALYYVLAFTITRYMVIGYHWYSSRLVFSAKKIPFSSIKGEIVKNFADGFPLMIAGILQGTIILVSRLLVQVKYGIETFSAYSFSLHTIVIATQFIGAVATVFYPIMKRADNAVLHQMYNSFDKIATIASALLLLSYFLIVIVVKIIYYKYIVILDYLFFVYPLFIYNCKSNILVINYFKVRNQPKKMVVVNALGTLINAVFVFAAYYMFNTVYAIACAVLLGYALWYYLCQIYIYKIEHWKLRITVFYDFLLVLFFEMIVILINILIERLYVSVAVGAVLFILLCTFAYFINKKRVDASIKEFSRLLKD